MPYAPGPAQRNGEGAGGRTFLKVVVAEGDKEDTGDLVVSPMGKKTGIALTQRTTASSRLATLVEP